MAGVYLFLVKEMKILLGSEETAILYVLVVVKYWLKEEERDMNGNEQSILVRLISLFYPPQKTKLL